MTPRVLALHALAAELDELTDLSPRLTYLVGVFEGLTIADRHPEVVGMLIDEIATGADGTPMPADIRATHAEHADSVAWANRGGGASKPNTYGPETVARAGFDR